MEQFTPGHMFEGKYRIRGELGRGGFGRVYLAHQSGMDRNVALKVLNPDINSDAAATARERFLREVKIISKLRHPNTVTIHDFGETPQGMVYMVLEFVEGETLKSVQRRRGAIDEQRAIQITIQIAKSLSEAHRHGIIHRDLKPANIMLTEMGGEQDFVKVLDFGIARLRDRKHGAADLTTEGLPTGQRALIGTPRYMSPEQVRGEELTGASDVYSLGLMLYEMLSGEPAVQGDTTMALITQQISPEPLQLGNLNRMHPHLQHIVIRAVSKDLTRRYRTVDVFAQELDQARAGIQRERMGYGSGLQEGSNSDNFILNNQYDQYQSGQWSSANRQGPQQSYSSGHYTQPQRPMHTPQQSYPQQHASGGYPAQQRQNHPQHPQHPSGGYPAQNPQQGHPPQQPYPQQQPQPQPQPQSGFQPNDLQRFGDGGYHGGNTNPPQYGGPEETTQRRDQSPSDSVELPEDLPPGPNNFEQSAFEPSRDEPLELDEHAASSSNAKQPQREQRDRGDSLGFAINLAIVLAFALGLLGSLYILFLTMGATVELIIDGPIRFIITVIAALMLPTVPLIAEGGARERYTVEYRFLTKTRRALTAGLVLTLGSSLLLLFAFPNQIVSELRGSPNWFLGNTSPHEEQGLTALNRKFSYAYADLVEKSGAKTGLYNPADHAVPLPPKPTRPQNDAATDAEDAPAGDAPESEEAFERRPAKEAKQAPKRNPMRDATRQKRGRTRSADTGEDAPTPPTQKERDPDYVEW